MNRAVKVWSVFLGVFAAGIVVGALVAARLTETVVERAREVREAERIRTPEPTDLMLLRRYAARLELSPAQIEQIRPAMDAAGEDLRRLRQDSAMSLQRLEQQMEAALSPDQLERLQAMQSEQKERWRRMVELREAQRRPPGEGPPPPKPPPPPGR
jgi:hypothetical protein